MGSRTIRIAVFEGGIMPATLDDLARPNGGT